MRVLVAYGSKMGGTEGLAEMLGDELRSLGHEVEVARGRDVRAVTDYDAVVIGGALYYFFLWHKDARRVVRKHRSELSRKPVWLFSSGPLDSSATEKDIAPIKAVRKRMAQVGAHGHVTFGGRLENESRGLPLGDWRDPDHVKRWAAEISADLAGAPA